MSHLIGCLLLWNAVEASSAADVKNAVGVIRAVGPDAKGSAAAAKAWQLLAAADAAQLPELLAAMDGANPLARNWLRSAIDQVLETAKKEKKPLPLPALESFLQESKHDPKARRLAYELILEIDKTAADRYLPNMMDDPSPELRRDAVARALEEAEKVFNSDKKVDSLRLFRKCLVSARDQAQIKTAVSRLRELDFPVDVPRHLGLIQTWHIIGPFTNAEEKHVDTVYPPEKQIDLSAEYDGKDGKIKWKPYVSHQEYALVNLNEGLGQHLESIGYAMTEFTSAREQNVEIRIGCFNVFKLFVNGELVLERGDAYTGMKLDHYVAQAKLKQGKNVILMKLCQGKSQPQVGDLWQFQLRVCDAGGVAILSTMRPKVEPVEKKP
jgi:hypothetical protein